MLLKLKGQLECEAGKLSRLFYAGYQLSWVNETQGDQEPYERRHHINDRHRVNRLTGSNARRKHGIVQGYDQCLAVGTCCQERQFKHCNRTYQHKETGCENSRGEQWDQHVNENAESACTENPCRGFETRVNLFDKRCHH